MNKNKKITIAILMGLTVFTMVGCGENPSDPASNEKNEVEISDKVLADDASDAKVEKPSSNKKYTVDEVKADFKIIENFAIEVNAASFNDAFVAAFASQSKQDVDTDKLFMDVEISKAKKEISKIKSAPIKKLADLYVDLYEKQSDLVKKLGMGEIDEIQLEQGVSDMMNELATTLSGDLEFVASLGAVLTEHDLNSGDVLSSANIQTEAISLAEKKYSKNMEEIMMKALGQ